MKIKIKYAFFFFVFLSCSQSPSGQTFVRVNGQKITEGDLGLLAKVNPRIQVELSNQEGKQRILENLVEILISFPSFCLFYCIKINYLI